MDKVVIIMPSYNEAKNISRMIDVLFNVEFPQIKDVEMHLLIVDDNSPDGTGDIVKTEMAKYPNLHLLSGEKKGLGWAYIRGMKYAQEKLSADAVMEMDADFQHPPKFVKDMVKAYTDGADYIIGSRYIKGGSVPSEWALSRKAVSFFGNLFIRIVFLKPSIHDLTTGFRLTRVKGVLDKIDLDHLMEPERFAYKVDLLYQSIKNAKKVVEVPFDFAPRTEEKSKFNPKEMISTFKVAIILGIKDKIRLIRFGIVGFTGFVINYAFIRVFRITGFTETLSWLLATEMAIISNFTWNNLWTFSEKKISGFKNVLIKFITFNLTSAGALLIQSVMGPLGTKWLGQEYTLLVLAVVVVGLVLPYNYLMYNLVIWKTWKNPFAKKS